MENPRMENHRIEDPRAEKSFVYAVESIGIGSATRNAIILHLNASLLVGKASQKLLRKSIRCLRPRKIGKSNILLEGLDTTDRMILSRQQTRAKNPKKTIRASLNLEVLSLIRLIPCQAIITLSYTMPGPWIMLRIFMYAMISKEAIFARPEMRPWMMSYLQERYYTQLKHLGQS